MPIPLSYPGVYIEEVPSGVKTITGTSTSITAFVGRCLKGLVNEPVTINSFADFERIFGGLWLDNHLGYAVRDFYLNGGSQAIIVRVHNSAVAASKNFATNDPETVDADKFKLTLKATSEGAWGNSLKITIEHVLDTDTVAEKVAEGLGITGADWETFLFNLIVENTATNVKEVFNYLTIKDTVRRVDRVLQSNSEMLRASFINLTGNDIYIPDTATATALTGGSDGTALNSGSIIADEEDKTGLYALEKADSFNLLCIPGFTDMGGDLASVVAYCKKRRAFFIVDPMKDWNNKEDAKDSDSGVPSLGLIEENAAIFFPTVIMPNPLRGNQLEEFYPCGMVAGAMARTDGQRGIWKAAAGIDVNLSGVTKLSVNLTDAENGELNSLGINCLRTLPAAGTVIWGARTLKGNDKLGSEWKYIPVRRMALYLEESLYRGLQWVVFEPNGETLWRQVTLNVDSFMDNLFRQGAFKGLSKSEAYFVKCDKETTTQTDIDNGVVNILVGFAPLKPAEFVVIKLQQIANQQ